MIYTAPLLLLLLLLGGGAAMNASNQPSARQAPTTSAASVPEPEATPIILSVGAIAAGAAVKKIKKA